MRLSTTAAAVAILTFGACDSASQAPTASERPAVRVECVEPSEATLEVDSDFELDVEPNPVAAGSVATVTVDYEGSAESYMGGLGALWECWDGDAWVNTHLVVRAHRGLEAVTLDLSTGSTLVPDVGLRIPNSRRIIIPDVEPGVYRLTDRLLNAFGGDTTTLTAHELVEVVEG